MQPVPTRPDASPVDHLDDLPVRLEFIAGSTVLAACDLGALGPGSVIALDPSAATGAVEICVEGRLIGHGELVSIGGRLGIEIKSFAKGFHIPEPAVDG